MRELLDLFLHILHPLHRLAVHFEDYVAPLNGRILRGLPGGHPPLARPARS